MLLITRYHTERLMEILSKFKPNINKFVKVYQIQSLH